MKKHLYEKIKNSELLMTVKGNSDNSSCFRRIYDACVC